MKTIKDYLIFIFKKKKILRLLSYFHVFLPSFLLYQIFKNLIRVGEYQLCQKIYLILSKRVLKICLAEKVFISKVVLIEIQKQLSIYTVDWKKDIKYQNLNLFIKNPIKNLSFFLKKNYDPLLINKIITEFIFCDSLIPITSKYFKAEMLLNIKANSINKRHIKLDNWWFQALGHIIYLDTFIKAILLKVIDVKKIYFANTKNCNLYLVNKYKKILKKNNLYGKKKDSFNLNIRFWNLDKYNQFSESENFQEYIQKKWRVNNDIFFNDKKEKNDFKILKKKIGIKSKIITINIRQNDFHPFDDNANMRNADLSKTLKILDEIKSDYLFVITGNTGNQKIKRKFKNLFDYSNSKFKSKKNDFLLFNFCDAFIGGASGPAHYMLTRYKPCLFTDWFPLEYSLKSDLCIIMPKVIKKNNKILSLGDINKLGIRIHYDGIQRIFNLGYKYEDNSSEDLTIAINKFVDSLNKKKWKNYGTKYMISPKNFDFHGIKKELNYNFLKARRTIYFEPSFVKKNKGFLIC